MIVGRLIQMAVRAGEKGWWHEYGPGVAGTYVYFETEVGELLMFGLAIVPGLLQTADYTRSLFRPTYQGRRDDDSRIDRRVALRQARQERLMTDPPLPLVAVIEESALMRPLGGPEY